jgi:hypothetical protein
MAPEFTNTNNAKHDSLTLCMYIGNPLHHTQKHWYIRTKGISTTLLYTLINTALLAQISITSLSAGHKNW